MKNFLTNNAAEKTVISQFVKNDSSIMQLAYSCSTMIEQYKSATQQAMPQSTKAGLIEKIILCFLVIAFLQINFVHAQTNYIPTGLKDYDFLDRLEIKTRMQDLYFSN
ncbi:MAG TPA: hypothetical protein PL045_01155, partial [Chitinophagaceae bacterium]|nr:hypothetical protein [Chitinophagaceae bacterium]